MNPTILPHGTLVRAALLFGIAFWLGFCVDSPLFAQESSEQVPPPPTSEVPSETSPAREPSAFEKKLDEVAGYLVEKIAAVLFFNVLFFTDSHNIPLAVIWLVLGAIFFTLRMQFISLRAFFHAIKVTMGKYDRPGSEGEVSHFQALTAALSATVGLGNIAGVAIAVATGGPGATFWMIVAGFLGMSSKFVECTLGQKYRQVRSDGRIMGGAMYYLSKGLAEKGMKGFGTFLATIFAILCIGGSFGGGNAFQVNQSLNALGETVPGLKENGWAYGLVMMVLVGIVIIGGIR
ncbi:MAG TPA: alanine:cation symporter family protein, partial [Planctomycetaceae bacterium]|nr:alanine:cation symporter family protein [Planctomycetaceae bacterium]